MELMWELLSRLEQWMPVPDMEQVNTKALNCIHCHFIAVVIHPIHFALTVVYFLATDISGSRYIRI